MENHRELTEGFHRLPRLERLRRVQALCGLTDEEIDVLSGSQALPIEVAEHLIENAKAKFERKGCDWIVANDVSPATGVMGGDRNTVHLLARENGEISVDSWPVMTKEQVAAELVARIAKSVEKAS